MKTHELMSFPTFFGRGRDLTKSFMNDADQFFTDLFQNRGLPRTNFLKSENGYDIEVSAPGYDKKQVEVSVEDGALNISFEKKESSNELLRQEFSYHCESRSFKLPENCDSDKIKTSMENGILKVHIPLKGVENEKSTRKLIPIE